MTDLHRCTACGESFALYTHLKCPVADSYKDDGLTFQDRADTLSDDFQRWNKLFEPLDDADRADVAALVRKYLSLNRHARCAAQEELDKLVETYN